MERTAKHAFPRITQTDVQPPPPNAPESRKGSHPALRKAGRLAEVGITSDRKVAAGSQRMWPSLGSVKMPPKAAYGQSTPDDQRSAGGSPVKRFAVAVLALVVLAFAGTFGYVAWFRADTLSVTQYPGQSRYGHKNGTVYFNQNGYRRVQGADFASFAPLLPKREGSTLFDEQIAGRDKNAVYIGASRAPNLDPATTENLGYQYLRDASRVVYGKKELAGADAAHFEVVHGYYAHDGKTLYYRGTPITGADVRSLENVFTSVGRKDYDYLKDAARVYYHEFPIPEADPVSFATLEIAADQWNTNYGYDGRRYFFEEMPLPSQVHSTGEQLAPEELRLLVADKGYSWVEMFYAGRNIYYFNTADRTLNLLYARESSKPFVTLERGLYHDGDHIYFACTEWVWGKGKYRGLAGKYGALGRLDVSPAAFVKTGTRNTGPAEKRGTFYQAGEQRYFHRSYTGAGGYLAALDAADASGNLRRLPVEEFRSVFIKDKSRIQRGYLGWGIVGGSILFMLLLRLVRGMQKQRRGRKSSGTIGTERVILK